MNWGRLIWLLLDLMDILNVAIKYLPTGYGCSKINSCLEAPLFLLSYFPYSEKNKGRLM
jgi:hypothetical protein